MLIEFKFLSLKELGLSGEAIRRLSSDELYALPPVARDLKEGKIQGVDYGDRLARRYRNLRLKTFVVVSLGFERICFLNAGAEGTSPPFLPSVPAQ